MIIKVRAIQAEDKVERRNAILDAAEGLFRQQPDRLSTVSEVADIAGLAKGTVYLYFSSKEEIFLALHLRHVGEFFTALVDRLNQPGTITVDDVWAVTEQRIVQHPSFLALGSMCFGMMERAVDDDTAYAFKLPIAEWVVAAGTAIERRFPVLRPGEGSRLLCHSYGLVIGMWQMLKPNGRRQALEGRPGLEIFRLDFANEARIAMAALWFGELSKNNAPSEAQ